MERRTPHGVGNIMSMNFKELCRLQAVIFSHTTFIPRLKSDFSVRDSPGVKRAQKIRDFPCPSRYDKHIQT